MDNKLNKDIDKISKYVKEFKTKNEEGFTWDEVKSILEYFPSIDMDKFNGALFGITCMSINGETVIYPWDIEKALLCGIEKRNLKEDEWD